MRTAFTLAALIGTVTSGLVSAAHAAPTPTASLVQHDQAGTNVHQGVCTAPARAVALTCTVQRVNKAGALLWTETSVTVPGPRPTQLEAVTVLRPVDAVGGYYRAVAHVRQADGKLVTVRSLPQPSIGQPGDVDTDGVIWNVAPVGNSWTVAPTSTNHTTWL